MSPYRLTEKEDVAHIYRSSFIGRTNREVENTRELTANGTLRTENIVKDK